MTWSAAIGAKEHPAAKVPGLIVSPATLPAGSRARFAIMVFPVTAPSASRSPANPISP